MDAKIEGVTQISDLRSKNLNVGTRGSRGQVTIFIIVAIVLVVGIVGVFYFMGEVDVESPSELGPKVFIDKCVRDVVEESVEKMLKNGGERVVSHWTEYHGSKYNYLCYQADDIAPCSNLHPMLEEQIEREIYLDTNDSVQDCFDSMREDFEARGYDITGHSTVYFVDLLPGNIEINLKKEFNVSKGGTSQSFENFNTKIPSPIYDLVQITREIVNSKALFCSHESGGRNLLDLEYNIGTVLYDGSEIYHVVDLESGIEFRFAIRGCVDSPGLI